MKILGWVVALPFIALALFVAARFMMCRPDGEVVRVATPMVEKIADYIVEHGVPESLADIYDLPYELEGCKVSVKYEKKIGDKFIKVSSENEADYILYEQSCSFHQKDRIYRVWLWFEKFGEIQKGDLQVVSNYSYVETRFEIKNYKLEYSGAYSWFKHHGTLCSSFKQ